MIHVSKKHQIRMFDLAHRIKRWSDCPNGRQHACVLALDGKYIRSTGYNGLKAQCPHETQCATYTRGHMRKVCCAQHAEVNAIDNLFQIDPKNLVAFVTKEPCIICTERLCEAGITTMYWQERKNGRVVEGNIEL
jgi:deoxycytidylate deaminase